MFYHYTTIPAFKSILHEADTKAQMCFWATRYDCFADKEEVKLGVETIHRLMPEVEKTMQSDRQISSMFDWSVIKDNKNLGYPYIVSFTSRPNNDYMWREYAGMDGVVMEIDNPVCVSVPDTPLLRLASCIYVDENSDDQLIEILHQEYNEIGLRILGGPQKERAFAILKEYPQMFVKLIATGMLSFTAPRIKGARDFYMEEETRAIIPLPISDYNTLIEGYDDTISSLGLNPYELRNLVANEHSRQRNDGSTMYYRDMHLPIHLLKCIYVRSVDTKTQVELFLNTLGTAIPVKLM
ncbi:MAG: hypothetical protein Q4E68_03310 [Prevotellaceae bacterium]|nr:hypothetical protein [Prevotellaceae bacterium]